MYSRFSTGDTLANAVPKIDEILAVLRGGGLPARAAKAFGEVHTRFDLIDAVRKGLPKQVLTAVARAATANTRDALAARRRILTDASWKRRSVRLSPDESDRTVRLARLVALTRYVWRRGDGAGAVQFLSTPRRELQGRSPIEYCGTDLGCRLVEDQLLDILYNPCA